MGSTKRRGHAAPPLVGLLLVVVGSYFGASSCGLGRSGSPHSVATADDTVPHVLRFRYSVEPREGRPPDGGTDRPLAELPADEVGGRFVEALRGVTAGTCVRLVYGGGPELGDPSVDLTLAVIEQPEAVARLVGLVEVEERRSLCACLGDRRLQFHRGRALVLSLSLHHGERLRWHNGPAARADPELARLEGDGVRLTEASAEGLARWLDSNAWASPRWGVFRPPAVAAEVASRSAGEDRGCPVFPPTVLVTPRGFEVRAPLAEYPPACAELEAERDGGPAPRAGAGHDLDRLDRCMTELAERTDLSIAFVLVREEVPYDLVMRAMAVVRGGPDRPLFPDAALALDASFIGWRPARGTRSAP